MKTLRSSVSRALPALALSLALTPALRAQNDASYAPPPPPEQQMDAPDQGAPPPDSQSDPNDSGDQGDASFQTFYDQLGSQGNWVQTDNYGYVWQPNVSDPDWRPYSRGHWVYTDDGWTWVADDSEPWGWATYHYGRWVNLDDEGWVWVPGYTWAPAWVSWRYGGGYCGWAPLPPETSIGIDFGGVSLGFHIGGDCDRAYDIGPGYYNFVPIGYLGERDYRNHYVNRYNNYTIINNTRNVTNINVGDRGGARFGRVSTGGPDFARINAESRTPIERASLVRADRAGNANLRGNQLAVFAPQLAARGNARPARVERNLAAAQANRGTDVSRPLVVNSRVPARGPSDQQVQAARAVHGNNQAAIATGETRLAPSLTRPLTSLPPRVDHRQRAAAADAVPPSTTNPGFHANAATAQSNRTDSGSAGNGSGRENRAATDRAVAPNSSPANRSGTHEAAPVQRSQSFAPQGQPEKRHEFAPSQGQNGNSLDRRSSSANQQRDFAPAQRQTAPIQHQASTQSERQDRAPQVRREEAPRVQHEAPEVRHQSFAPPQHQQAVPQAHQEVHAAAPANHPSNGGGGGNSGNKDQKK